MNPCFSWFWLWSNLELESEISQVDCQSQEEENGAGRKTNRETTLTSVIDFFHVNFPNADIKSIKWFVHVSAGCMSEL